MASAAVAFAFLFLDPPPPIVHSGTDSFRLPSFPRFVVSAALPLTPGGIFLPPPFLVVRLLVVRLFIFIFSIDDDDDDDDDDDGPSPEMTVAR